MQRCAGAIQIFEQDEGPKVIVGTGLTTMRWGMPPPPRRGGSLATNIRNTSSIHQSRRSFSTFDEAAPFWTIKPAKDRYHGGPKSSE